LGRGILLDTDFQMSDDRLPKTGPINREPVAACFFDQKPEDTRIGKEGKSDYANYYGARVFEEIQDSLQGWQNPPQIQIDMAKLKLGPALLESLAMLGPSKARRARHQGIDTVTHPNPWLSVVICRAWAMPDGPRKEHL
jgi:hypothetical protein